MYHERNELGSVENWTGTDNTDSREDTARDDFGQEWANDEIRLVLLYHPLHDFGCRSDDGRDPFEAKCAELGEYALRKRVDRGDK